MCKLTLFVIGMMAMSFEQSLDPGENYSAYLISYESSGLNVKAMVATPKTPMPPAGYPVIIANHGYVPNPEKYGVTADGKNARPGDYYRSVPEQYASRGFMVLIPDYRGHNTSEGFEFVHKPESVAWYAEDVVTLISSLAEIDGADLDNVFMWSHSMGGGVAIRAQLATDAINAASYWATMSVEDQVHRFDDINEPIIIQHAAADKSTSSVNSELFAAELERHGKTVSLHVYDSPDHYFTGDMRELAVDRDVAFFQSQMN
jgi:dienelactone hydrolase